jgi:hypothetical protein
MGEIDEVREKSTDIGSLYRKFELSVFQVNITDLN